MEAIRQAKNVLRKELKRRLKCLSDDEKIRQSLLVTQKLVAHPEYQRSARISVYLSMPDEVDTGGILRDLFSRDRGAGGAGDRRCYVPQYIGPRMNMLRLLSMEDFAALPRTKWNIQQPADDDEREDALESGGLDLIIVPGLGFTREGHRLGRGKGYYDTYQSRCVAESGRRPVTIALAFNEQICDNIPTDDHDVKIDYVLYADMEA